MEKALGTALSSVLIVLAYKLVAVTGWMILAWLGVIILFLVPVVVIALAYAPNIDKIIKQLKN